LGQDLLRHTRISLIIEGGRHAAVGEVADRAQKGDHRTAVRPADLFGQRVGIDRRTGELNHGGIRFLLSSSARRVSRTVHRVNGLPLPPLTGGNNAISASGGTRLASSAKALFTARAQRGSMASRAG